MLDHSLCFSDCLTSLIKGRRSKCCQEIYFYWHNFLFQNLRGDDNAATILQCDEFTNLFPETTKVQCLSDSGLFLDTTDVSGGRMIKNLYNGVVELHSVKDYQ